jgi:hypothetical protein
MTDTQTLPDTRQPDEPPSIAAARAREAAGDLVGADAIFAALYNQARPDPAMMIAWSRLRRRAGDAQKAASMLEVAHRAGGGAPVLVEMASLLIDQGNGERAGAPPPPRLSTSKPRAGRPCTAACRRQQLYSAPS